MAGYGDPAPAPGTGTTQVTSPAHPTQTPVWSLRGRWAHDQTSGDDDFTLSLDVAGDPTGIAQFEGKLLAATFGLAPALVGAADNPSGEEAAVVAALATVIGGLAASLLRDGSKTVVTGLTIDRLERGPSETSRTRFTVDYTVELSVDVTGTLPLQVQTQTDNPMKLRYRGVGVEIDTATEHWYDGIGLVTRDTVPEIVDPGSWQLGPPLDDLLRVTGARSGTSSSWLEVDLALSLDLGVVTLSNATVRVVFDGAAIQGRRAARPEGQGRHPGDPQGRGCRVGRQRGDQRRGAARGRAGQGRRGGRADPGRARTSSPSRSGSGSPPRSRSPTPGWASTGWPGGSSPTASAPSSVIPTWSSRSSTGSRSSTRTSTPREPGQYALGLGAVIGTAPDDGFTFNAKGMVTVEFPRPAVIFSIIATVISETAPVPSEQVPAPTAGGLSIIGLVVDRRSGRHDRDARPLCDPRHHRGRGALRCALPLCEPDRVLPPHRRRQPARPRGVTQSP